MPSIRVKGRILHQNLVPVGNAQVEIFDDDTEATWRGPRTRTDLLGSVATNENGWFEQWFELAVGDAPRISLVVSKAGRSFRFASLPPGEPQLVTDWPGPRLCLAHEDPERLVRDTRGAARRASLPVRRSSQLAGSSVRFGRPVVSLRPGFSTGTPLDALATPQVQPAPAYLRERAQVNDLFDRAAEAALADSALRDGERDSYRKMFEHLPAGTAFAPTGAPASLAAGTGTVSDAAFAAQRLGGANPMRISRVGSTFTPALPAGLAISDEASRRVARYTVAELTAARRLYVCDYRQLAPVYAAFGVPSCAKLATVGLFFLADVPPSGGLRLRDPRAPARALPVGIDFGNLRRDSAATPVSPPSPPSPPSAGMPLMPLAILLIEPGRADRTVLPGEAEWELAKLALQANDAVMHEMKYHLWDCHFAMEPVVLSMIRQLDELHPLRELLVRHTYGLLWINNYGFEHLVNPGGPAATFLGVGLDGVASLLALAQAEWTWATTDVRRHLADRGLDALPSFPYRDDALRLFDAIRVFTGEYVDVYYDNDAEVARDDELQAWRAEMNGFGVVGLPALTTRPALAQLLAELIFQMAVQHAAVNTPQWDYLSNSLNAPAYLKPLTASPPPPDALAARLPDVAHAVGMMQLMGKLANFFVEPRGLGHYRDQWHPERTKELRFSDGPAEAAAKRFRDALDALETTIQQEALTRAPRYDYLVPSKLDNSTHK
jgi:hypothetical protein